MTVRRNKENMKMAIVLVTER